MKKEMRKHDAAVKAKVVLEVIRGQKTQSQISSEYRVHPNQITNWKKQFFEALPEVFSSKNQQREQNWGKEKGGVT
ncbi:MAG: transposase [Candidatus Aenigmatarchaeota archaeon]